MEPFITTWNTDEKHESRDSENNQITFPGKGNYSISWEEVGNPTNTGTATGKDRTLITFPNKGTYQLSVTGITGIKSVFRDHKKLKSIDQWGDSEWLDLEQAFSNNYDLQIKANDAPNLSKITSLKRMFSNCFALTGNISMNKWDVSNVTNMEDMFARSKFNQEISSWDMSSVTDMSSMFNETPFNQDIGKWDVSKVIVARNMFYKTPFNQDISLSLIHI